MIGIVRNSLKWALIAPVAIGAAAYIAVHAFHAGWFVATLVTEEPLVRIGAGFVAVAAVIGAFYGAVNGRES
jgi:hypothetical protein